MFFHVSAVSCRFCNVCRKGLDPKNVTCQLCLHTGGAYKPTDTTGEWVHALCASWIPEVFCLDYIKVEPFVLKHMDKKRFKLKCTLCSLKGACIQCCYGRCAVSAHPSCILNPSHGFTHRIIKDENDELCWEVFCKSHADAVKDPLKPKAKQTPSKASHIPEVDITSPSTPHSHSRRVSAEKHDRSYGSRERRAYSSNTPDASPNEALLAYVETVSRGLAKNAIDNSSENSTSLYKKKYLLDDDALSASTLKYIEALKAKAIRKVGDCDEDEIPKSFQSISESSLISVNASDWPGQSEGEAMDLEHFWNIVSMSCPEDHPVQWVETTLNPILAYVKSIQDSHTKQDKDAGVVHTVTSDFSEKPSKPRGRLKHYSKEVDSGSESDTNIDNYYALPAVDPDTVINQKLFDNLSELISSINSTKGLSHILDIDRRLDFQTKSIELANQMRCAALNGDHCAVAQYSVMQEEIDFVSKKSNCFNYDAQTEGNGRVRVAIDSEPNRVVCEYDVELSDECTGNSCTQPVHSPDTVALGANSVYDRLHPSSNNVDDSNDDTGANATRRVANVSLVSFGPLDHNKDVALVERRNQSEKDKVVVSMLHSRMDDDLICRMIRSDQHTLRSLSSSMAAYINRVISESDYFGKAERSFHERIEIAKIENTYRRQRAWKKICVGMSKGMKDQDTGFNKQEFESVPKSWKIEVSGRPPKDESDEEDEEEHQEDAVCMVCFDGTSVDGNRILFCDGCNASLHQACYGVTEIPEGDFFCDRCNALGTIAEEIQNNEELYDPSGVFDLCDHAKDLIGCCYCPKYHGGFKPTTDGRWIHLCCALWSNTTKSASAMDLSTNSISDGAVIMDVIEMSPIDVSRVHPAVNPIVASQADKKLEEPFTLAQDSTPRKYAALELSPGAEESSSGPLSGVLPEVTQNMKVDTCCLCKTSGGYLTSCCGNNVEDTSCTEVFHPICAWFEGYYISTTVTDMSFTGASRSGLYPSGCVSCFYCNAHCPVKSLDTPDAGKTVAIASPGGLRTECSDASGNTAEAGASITLLASSPRVSQATLRQKYQIVVADLMNIPGQRPSKHKKKNKYSSARGQPNEPVALMKPDIYDESFCAMCMMPVLYSSVKNPDDVASENPLPSGAICAECPSPVVPVKMETTDGDDCNGAAAKSTVESPEHNDCPIKSNSPMEVSEEEKRKSMELAESKQGHSPEGEIVTVGQVVYTCRSCQLTVHAACLLGTPGGVVPEPKSDWICPTCWYGTENDAPPMCFACPRMGGYFHHLSNDTSNAGLKIHHYCAVHTPGGHTKVDVKNGSVEMKMIPKECKKQKCSICNRKCGVTVKCQQLGCSTKFHVMCADRSGKGYCKIRGGVSSAFCEDHIPDGVFQLENGFWVDVYEVQKLRVTLDTARIALDMLKRREKLKKQVSLCDGELYNLHFSRLLDRAMGRKSSSHTSAGDGGLNDDLDYQELFSFDEDEEEDLATYGMEWESLVGAGRSRGRKSKANLEESMDGDVEAMTPKKVKGTLVEVLNEATGEYVEVSSTFVKRNKLAIPGNVVLYFCGQQLTNSDPFVITHASASKPAEIAHANKLFLKELQMDIQKVMLSTRENCDIFKTTREADAFPLSLARDLQNALLTSNAAFTKQMAHKSITVQLDPESDVNSDRFKVKKVKKEDPNKLLHKVIKIPAWKNSGEMEKLLMEDETFISLLSHVHASVNTHNKNCIDDNSGKGASHAVIDVLNLDKMKSPHATSYKIHTDEDRCILERRIQYVLDMMEHQHIPDVEYQVLLAGSGKGPGKKAAGKGKGTHTRQLIKDYLEIPYETIPDYDMLVRHPISMETMHAKLQAHEYLSFSCFEADYYEMLNNGRSISTATSDVRLFDCVHMHLLTYLLF